MPTVRRWPNAYVVGNEEAFNNDLQDAVFIVRNVVPVAVGQASAPVAGATVYQAESATLVGATKQSGNGGYTGTGYADFTNNAGDSAKWSFSRSKAGTVDAQLPLRQRLDGRPTLGTQSEWCNCSSQAVAVGDWLMDDLAHGQRDGKPQRRREHGAAVDDWIQRPRTWTR